MYKEEPLHDRKFGVHATSALCWQATMNMNEVEKDSQKEVKTTLQVDQVELRANTKFRTSHLVIRTFLFFNTAHTHPSPQGLEIRWVLLLHAWTCALYACI